MHKLLRIKKAENLKNKGLLQFQKNIENFSAPQTQTLSEAIFR